MDVFKGQMADPVLKVFSNNNILLQSVPASFTYVFQPLDAQGGPNRFLKRLMRKKVSNWYAVQIAHAMDDGRELDSIDIELKLSIIKSCKMDDGSLQWEDVSWRKRGMLTRMGGIWYKTCSWAWCSKLPNPDSFDDIYPMLEEDFTDIMIIASSAILQAVS